MDWLIKLIDSADRDDEKEDKWNTWHNKDSRIPPMVGDWLMMLVVAGMVVYGLYDCTHENVTYHDPVVLPY